MRAREVRVFKHLVERGLTKRALRRAVNVEALRARLDRKGGSVEDVAADVALDLATQGAGSAAGAVAESVVKPIVERIFPPPPPLPVGFTTEIALRNCSLRLAGQVGEDAYIKIDVSDNGDTWFFDTPGRVEIITDPPLPTPPGGDSSANVIDGNGSIAILGSRTVWLHLKGEEDVCSVDITIFPSAGGN